MYPGRDELLIGFHRNMYTSPGECYFIAFPVHSNQKVYCKQIQGAESPILQPQKFNSFFLPLRVGRVNSDEGVAFVVFSGHVAMMT